MTDQLSLKWMFRISFIDSPTCEFSLVPPEDIQKIKDLNMTPDHIEDVGALIFENDDNDWVIIADDKELALAIIMARFVSMYMKEKSNMNQSEIDVWIKRGIEILTMRKFNKNLVNDIIKERG